jgi:hypothetical protein
VPAPPPTPLQPFESEAAPDTNQSTPDLSAAAAVEQPKLAPAAKVDKVQPRWIQTALAEAAASAVEEMNEGVFKAISARFNATVALNDHDLPAFSLDLAELPHPPLKLDFVLSPHYLLCSLAQGYVRFGTETRIFLNKLDDYFVFPGRALRGALERNTNAVLALIVAPEFAQFVRSEKGYAAPFAQLLCGADQVQENDHILWPLSDEEKLFEAVAQSAQSYGLPVTHNQITLEPNNDLFVGFNRTLHGMEFRDGEEYIRFLPQEIHVHEEDRDERIAATRVLCGWALDPDGHLCALYRPESGFVPPPDLKLLHFVPLPTLQTDNAFTLLGAIP